MKNSNQSIKLGQRINKGFNLIILLIVCMIIVSIISNIVLASYTKGLYKGPYKLMFTIGELKLHTNDMQRAVYNAITFDDPEDIRNVVGSFNDVAKELEKDLNALKGMTDEEYMAPVNEFERNIQNTYPLIEKIEGHLLKFDADGNNEYPEATAVMVNEARPFFVEAEKQLSIIEENSHAIAENYLAAETIAQAVVIVLMILMLVLNIVFSRKIGNRLANSILTPVSELVKSSTLLANGETNINITYNQKDELGILADSIREIVDTVKALIEEADVLTQGAVAGDLKVRGNADRFSGGYQQIVQGVNKTLDTIMVPVNEAMSTLEEISKGNLHVQMTGDYQGDYANIKDTMNFTADTLLTYVDEISRVLSEIAQGNLQHQVTADYRGDFIEIKNSLNQIIGSLNGVLGDIHEASEQVASGSRQVSDGSQALSQGSTEQASSIQELTASISEIAAQTKANAVKAGEVYELANSTKEAGSKGNDQMQNMLSSMEEINESSANIQKIIKVIDDIAFQTNILALNAAVEAARAGQHGKGFAVVAEEVRNLAARSAEAAKETSDLIEGSISKVQTGRKIANETAKSLAEIADGAVLSSAKINEIALASNEQATAIAQVNKGIEQIAQVVQSNSATAEQSAAASEELSSQAELLKEMVGRFKLNNKAGNHNITEFHQDEDGEIA